MKRAKTVADKMDLELAILHKESKYVLVVLPASSDSYCL